MSCFTFEKQEIYSIEIGVFQFNLRNQNNCEAAIINKKTSFYYL